MIRPAGRAALLGQDGMIRVGFPQRADDRVLRFPVDLGDKVVRRLLPEGDDVEVARGAVDDVARPARGLDRDVDHWMHKFRDS